MAKQRELINMFGVRQFIISRLYNLCHTGTTFLGRSCCVPNNAERQGAHRKVSHICAALQHHRHLNSVGALKLRR